MKKILLLTVAFLLVFSCFSCKRKDDTKLPSDGKAELISADYTIVYEPTPEQSSVVNYDYSARVFATDESDDVPDNKTVNEADLAATLCYTGLVTEKDKSNKQLTTLSLWYIGKIKPKEEISFDALTFSDAVEIVQLYIRNYYYSVTPEEIDVIFSEYDQNAILTHKDFKVITAKLTALFKDKGFKFDIDADNVSKIVIVPSLTECCPLNEDGTMLDRDKGQEIRNKRTVTVTEKADIEKELEFLKNADVLKAEYIDGKLTGDSKSCAVYDVGGNEILSFALLKNDHIYFDHCLYTFESGTFDKIIEKVTP